MAENKNKRDRAFLMEVDATKTYEQLVNDGKYDRTDPCIKSRNFPIRNISRRTSLFKLFFFSEDMSSEEIIRGMKRGGYKPATIEEHLVFGVKRPELQKKFNIIALGSIHNEYVPSLCFHRDTDARMLNLVVCKGKWRSYLVSENCFLAVRKNFRIFKRKK